MQPSALYATVYVRNSGGTSMKGRTLPEHDAVWEGFGPGIRPRVVCQPGNEACYLVRAEVGANVPTHGHHVDKDCLIREGELCLGDIALRAGEFQLAPAGIERGIVQAANQTLICVRGDIAPAVELVR